MIFYWYSTQVATFQYFQCYGLLDVWMDIYWILLKFSMLDDTHSQWQYDTMFVHLSIQTFWYTICISYIESCKHIALHSVSYMVYYIEYMMTLGSVTSIKLTTYGQYGYYIYVKQWIDPYQKSRTNLLNLKQGVHTWCMELSHCPNN